MLAGRKLLETDAAEQRSKRENRDKVWEESKRKNKLLADPKKSRRKKVARGPSAECELSLK